MIVRKTTLIKMNTKPIDDVYKRDTKVRDLNPLKKLFRLQLWKKFHCFGFVLMDLTNDLFLDSRKRYVRRGVRLCT